MVKKRASIKGMGAEIFYGIEAAPPSADTETRPDLKMEKLLEEEIRAAEPLAEVVDFDLEELLEEEARAAAPLPERVAPPPEAPSRPTVEAAPRPEVTPAIPTAPPSRERVAPPPEAPLRPTVEAAPRPEVTPAISTAPPPRERVAPPPEAPLRPTVEAAPRPEVTPAMPTAPPPRERVAPPPEAPLRPTVEAAPPPEVRPAIPTTPKVRPETTPPETSAVPAGPAPAEAFEYMPPPKLKLEGVLAEEAARFGTKPRLTPPGPMGEPEEEEPLPEISPGDRADQPSRIRAEEEVLDFFGRNRERLNKKITELYEVVPRELNGKEMNRTLNLLGQARDILAERPRQFDEAENIFARAEAILENRRRIRRSTNTYGMAILIYEIIWFLLLFGSFIFGQSLAEQFLGTIQIGNMKMADFITPFWTAMAWGGIGGVVGALWALHWHVGELQDFDKQYSMWYLLQPIMGLILGGAMYLILRAGFLVVQIGEAPGASIIQHYVFPSLLAFIAGFRQNMVYETIDRIIQVIMPKPEVKEEEEEEIPKVTVPSTE